MKESSIKVFDYVKSMDGKNITAADIAEATGLEVKSVNGILTSSFQRHKKVVGDEKVIEPLMERVPAEIEVEDENGNPVHKQVKFVRLTDAGRAFTPSIDE